MRRCYRILVPKENWYGEDVGDVEDCQDMDNEEGKGEDEDIWTAEEEAEWKKNLAEQDRVMREEYAKREARKAARAEYERRKTPEQRAAERAAEQAAREREQQRTETYWKHFESNILP